MSATQPARPRRARSTRGPRAALALACAVGLVGAPAASAAPDLERVDPAKVGLSAKRLERLTRYVDDQVSEGELAGSVVALLRKGKLAYLHTSGHAEIDSKRPLRSDAIFRIRSMTKPITAVAVLILVEEGRIALQDPVTDWFPEFANLRVVGEYGWSGSAGTFFWVDPAEEMVGLFLTQIFPPDVDDIHRRIKALANQALAD